MPPRQQTGGDNDDVLRDRSAWQATRKQELGGGSGRAESIRVAAIARQSHGCLAGGAACMAERNDYHRAGHHQRLRHRRTAGDSDRAESGPDVRHDMRRHDNRQLRAAGVLLPCHPRGQGRRGRRFQCGDSQLRAGRRIHQGRQRHRSRGECGHPDLLAHRRHHRDGLAGPDTTGLPPDSAGRTGKADPFRHRSRQALGCVLLQVQHGIAGASHARGARPGPH